MDYQTKTVQQLKELLRMANLPVSGKKADLIERLSESDSAVINNADNIDKISTANGFTVITPNPKYFTTPNNEMWERFYQENQSQKYKKNTKKATIYHPKRRWDNPPIYLIPRQRGGPSYKSTKLQDAEPEDIYFALISKGFAMQNVSSFSLGPIPGQGLCLVNSAFSKSVYIYHLEGGHVNLKRKTFWQPKKERTIEIINSTEMLVDGKTENIHHWCQKNEHLWKKEWEKWRQHIALCSQGSFHWGGGAETVIYVDNDGKYLDFIQWKKKCYIQLSFDLLEKDPVFKQLRDLLSKGIGLGLVHPMAMGGLEKPITTKFLQDLFDSETEMCCQPFVIAAKLLGMQVN